MNNGSLSILIPTYARTGWLQEALWCAMHQTVPVPIIVLSDCPRQTLICDHPLVTIHNYKQRSDTLGAKHDELLRLADTEWITWLNDDEWLLPWYVEDLQRFLDRDAEAVFTDTCWYPSIGAFDGRVQWRQSAGSKLLAARRHSARGLSPAGRNFSAKPSQNSLLCSIPHIAGKGNPYLGKDFDQDPEIRLDRGSEPSGCILLSPSLNYNYFDDFPNSRPARDQAHFWSIPIPSQKRRTYALGNLSLTIVFPSVIRQALDFLFGDLPLLEESAESSEIVVSCDPGTGRYTLWMPAFEERAGILTADLPRQLLGYVLRWLAASLKSGLALRAGAVSRGNHAVILPGMAGSDNSIVMAWLLSMGFHFISDRIVLIEDNSKPIRPLRHPIVMDQEHAAILGRLTGNENIEEAISSAPGTGLVPWRLFAGSESSMNEAYPALILFAEFRPETEISLQAISPAQATMHIMANTVNGRNLSRHGMQQAAQLTRTIPALQLVYGNLQQLSGCLDRIVSIVLDYRFGAKELVDFLAPFNRHRYREELARPAARSIPAAAGSMASAARPDAKDDSIPPATPQRQQRKLTIGMATYDDYDGVYFSVQALRLYHAECINDIEIIVIDNHPAGPCAKALKNLDAYAPNYRYIPERDMSGPAVKDVIFREAAGEFVLVIDSHVLIIPGAIRRLFQFFEENPDCGDLLQGPLLHDDLKGISTNYQPTWRGGMFGIWQTDQRGYDIDGEPFEIPAQGVGLFCCRRDRWPGFNPRFRGFGGEEGYIHEKFRRAGGRILCLPFLRWLHRFNRPMGVPYPVDFQDRIFNFLVGFHELGMNSTVCKNHFIDHLGETVARQCIAEAEKQIRSPFFYFDAIYCPAARKEAAAVSATRESLDTFAAAKSLKILSTEVFSGEPELRRLLVHRHLLEKARKFDYHHLLVIEEGTTFTKETADKLAELLRQLEETKWQVFLLDGHPDAPVAANESCMPPALIRPQRLNRVRTVAYHHRSYEVLLASLPQEGAVPSIQEDAQNLEHFLLTCPETYLATPSLVTI